MSLPPLRDVIAAHEIGARKSLGQNFLLDLNLTRRIARAAGIQEGDTVYEVGPGPGGLTRALLETGAKRVITVERDPRCVAAQQEISAAYPDRHVVHEADALAFDEAKMLKGMAPIRVVANLPYNIATPLAAKWLEESPWPPWYESLTLMFQREVAERLAAGPGTKEYGRLSVLAQWRTIPKKLFDVPPTAFVPPPKVTSSVVGFTVRAEPVAPAEMADLQAVTKAAFGQRRKMLRSSLKALGAPVDVFAESVGIDLARRAETLSVEEFCALAQALTRYRAAH